MDYSSATVVGGGIVGLAVALRLSQSGVAVTVVEKESAWAAHQTGHNSGVIHAGPYYRPGSLKATMCTAGNASMVAFAQEYGIPHEVCGKLIVATDPSQLPGLRTLYERGQANGTPCELISAERAREIEPHVHAVGALHVHSTGIIDYSEVTRTYARLAAENGADLVLGSAVRAIHNTPTGVTVEHDRGRVTSDVLINCAGLQSDRVARLAGLEPEVRIVPFRGEYYELAPERRFLVNKLIYPVPDPDLPFLGVHFTRMIDGSVHAGPNAVFAFAREGYRWRDIVPRDVWDAVTYPGFLKMASHNVVNGAHELVRSASRSLFAASLAKLVPDVTKADIVPSGSGVRAQAIRPNGSLADDFIIQYAPRQVHVLNAPSPAATASLEIAKAVVAQSRAA
ncbi:MAG TPA: L-2-hydroxyglutarate oxidase [Propionibacteriaceae bacterium]|nr:L-2-hydroxyglutarate oxidase [Propionibacteriaceae bacterium]